MGFFLKKILSIAQFTVYIIDSMKPQTAICYDSHYIPKDDWVIETDRGVVNTGEKYSLSSGQNSISYWSFR